MSLQLRQGKSGDAVAIANVKTTLWPDEATSPNYIAEVVQQPDHHTILAIYKEQVLGFVDGFLTLSASGQRRWEVDLLGVHPKHHGQGMGTQLMQAITQAGREMEAEVARGLVATENIGSQKAFAKAGYVVGERPLNLWVSSIPNIQSPISNLQLPSASYLLPVTTLNYQGAWLEGELSTAGMQAAQAICTHMGWAIAGTLIDVEDGALNEAAQKVGYVFVNQFQWWWRGLLINIDH